MKAIKIVNQFNKMMKIIEEICPKSKSKEFPKEDWYHIEKLKTKGYNNE